jgi:hypothetical protein
MPHGYQAATSHIFRGDGIARAFNITFSDKNNQLTYPHQEKAWCFTTLSSAA